MRSVFQTILTNGFLPLLPIFLWNLCLTAKLPPAYEPKNFDSNIPGLLLRGEDFFRAIIFLLPLFFKINVSTAPGKLGLIIYIAGSLVYYFSWLALVFAPRSLWSKSLLGFAAPAYTPVIWLTGISLMADTYYFNLAYSTWHYLVPCILFSLFHVSHTWLVYLKNKVKEGLKF
ncbi:MAG TPA: hypothetical protein VEC37_04745 [Bacillota bacterium]|nr:hypothetical protein [Bacillota bacterium]